MIAPLLQTKLYIPPVRPQLVPRPHLLGRLNEGMTRKLTLVSAPAGFGKTTLLSEWAHNNKSWARGSPRIAWISLDEGDNDPMRFLSYLIAALRMTTNDIGGGALGALQTPHPPPMETLLTVLINQISAALDHGATHRQAHPEGSQSATETADAALPPSNQFGPDREIGSGLVLVLDDYHLIATQSVHDALEFLLDHLPGNMHLVIATRSDPPLHLPRLRGRGQLAELRVPDLRFTLEEVTVFLNDAMKLDLSPEDVAALAARTEGWIASLQMAAISMQGRHRAQDVRSVSELIQAFSGGHRFILDYLMEEVLNQQPPAIQEFLIRTSILERLSGPLCDAVCATGTRVAGQDNGSIVPVDGGTQLLGDGLYPPADVERALQHDAGHPSLSGQATLEMLERANLFIIPLDDGRSWYRYHRLFADLLRQRLHQAHPDLLPMLHARASEWYEQSAASRQNATLMNAAIDHALSAGDCTRAGRLVEQVAEPTLMRSELATFKRWLEILPDEWICTRSLLCVQRVLLLFMAGCAVEKVQSRLRDAMECDTDGLVAGELTALCALLVTAKGDLRRGTELSHQALKLLPDESLLFRDFVVRNLGTIYILTGDVAAASQTFDEAARFDQKVGNLFGAVADLQRLALMRIIQGRLNEARVLHQRALELGVDEKGQPLPVVIKVMVGLGMLFYQWNDLQTATRYLLDSIELAGKWADVWGMGGHLFLAYTRQAQGDVEGAREAMQKAYSLAIEYDTSDLDDVIVAAYQARLWVAQDELEAAARWAAERGLDRNVAAGELGDKVGGIPAFYHLRELEYITAARLYLAQGRPDDALAVLKPVLEAAEGLGRTGSAIEILVLQALAWQAQADVAQALACLRRALSLSEPAGYVRVFADEGAPMAELLRHMAIKQLPPAASISQDYVRRLLRASENEVEGKPQPKDEARKPAVVYPSFVVDPSPDLVELLTERELQVLRLLTTHLSSTEIAEELVIAASTVRSHIKNIYGKLDVHSRREAIQRADALRLL